MESTTLRPFLSEIGKLGFIEPLVKPVFTGEVAFLKKSSAKNFFAMGLQKLRVILGDKETPWSFFVSTSIKP